MALAHPAQDRYWRAAAIPGQTEKSVKGKLLNVELSRRPRVPKFERRRVYADNHFDESLINNAPTLLSCCDLLNQVCIVERAK